MVFPTGGYNLGEVTPNPNLLQKANILKGLLILAGICMGVLCFGGQLWALLQIVFLGLGYFAISDPNCYKSTLMQSCFVTSVFGAAFSVINLLTVLSMGGLLLKDCIIFGVASGSLIGVSVLSWLMYKEMLHCSPAVAPAFQQTGEVVYSSSESVTNPSGGFVPFSGQGYRLG